MATREKGNQTVGGKTGADGATSKTTGPGEDDLNLKYNMNSSKHGRFIIINNVNFKPKTGQKERSGSDVDADNLKKVFEKLEFEVVEHKDLTTTNMLKVMVNESKRNHSAFDCFGVAVLTHGVEGKLYGTDDLIEIDSFIKPIKNCQSLWGKPKIFFFQACREEKFDEEVLMETDDLDSKSNPATIRLPLEADFLFALSNVPGYYAWHNEKKGSWFVQALVAQLGTLVDKNVDLLHILTRVNDQVARDFESSSDYPWMHGKKQVHSIVSMLTKDLYFSQKSS